MNSTPNDYKNAIAKHFEKLFPHMDHIYALALENSEGDDYYMNINNRDYDIIIVKRTVKGKPAHVQLTIKENDDK